MIKTLKRIIFFQLLFSIWVTNVIAQPILYNQTKGIENWDINDFIDLNGVKKPTDFQKAVFLSLEATKKNNKNGIYFLGKYSDYVDMPMYLKLAWSVKALEIKNDKSLILQQEKMLSIIKNTKSLEDADKSEILRFSVDVKLPYLIELTEKFMLDRRAKIGPIEPHDLVNEGWVQFVGYRGKVNEPMAQLLTEEGLRLSVALNYEWMKEDARNNLGVILSDAANKYIKNSRLANVHLLDAYKSRFAPSNLLWDEYENEITLTKEQIKELRIRYKQEKKREHPTVLMAGNNKIKTVPEILKNLIGEFEKKGDPEIANEIADFYEGNLSSLNIDECIKWYEKYLILTNQMDISKPTEISWKRDLPNEDTGKSDYLNSDKARLDRIKLIKEGKYEKDIPILKDGILKLYGINILDNLNGDNKKQKLQAKKNGSEKKFYALVIGNSSYKSNALLSSETDADKIAKKLKAFGFQVNQANNLTKDKFQETLLDFTAQAKDSELTVIYYSGHGMQVGGLNYLIPIDFDLKKPKESLALNAISLNEILRQNIPGKARIIFLDACRNSPYKNDKGLAPVNIASGTLISYATRDGSLAYDGSKNNMSAFTDALVKHIDDQEDIAIVLRNVREDVLQKTKGKQEPWEYGSLGKGKYILSNLNQGL